MTSDALHYPYPSSRKVVFAKNGMVAASQPLAAEAGLAVMRGGGNAVDAAVAAAACLTVVEPASNGIGGDAFALIWTKGKLFGLNSSGAAPRAISLEAAAAGGITRIPRYGWMPVTVPGAPAAWAAMVQRFGSLSLKQVLEPAADYAENGYPVSPVLGEYWERAFHHCRTALEGREFEPWFRTFAPGGSPPGIGEIWRSKDHARTLRLIGESDAETFYRGETARRIDAFSREFNGFLRAEDLAAFQPEWVQPISVNYRGYDIWELPPNGQGLIALIALNILKGFTFPCEDPVDTSHRLIEALKLAFADGLEYIADPSRMSLSAEALLEESYAENRRRTIGERAAEPAAGSPEPGGTVYLAAADAMGNMVSFIQSNYMGFGSGLVVPGTGIALHNRGCGFSLNPGDANCLAPGKKPYHTIIPGFITKDSQALGPFGVMGGFMQPQGHVQVMMNMIDFQLNPQAALDAPRLQWLEKKRVAAEPDFPRHIARALARRGHEIVVSMDQGSFGRGQIILRDPKTGVLSGGTEPRADGTVAAY